MPKTEDSRRAKDRLIDAIWKPPGAWRMPGAWLWWFWIFFIHDKNTAKTGKCRQLMILWSIKKDSRIACNSMEMRLPVQLENIGYGEWRLNGAVAAWYFDGRKMHDNFLLEKTSMRLNPDTKTLVAPGVKPSSFRLAGRDFEIKIQSGEHKFELRARQADAHPALGPNFGASGIPGGPGIEGTRMERLELSGFESLEHGETRRISGTAYFQRIMLAIPPPQWYWGLYHFADGSFFTYLLPYFGRQSLADNLWKGARLTKPHLPLKQDIFFYHAPSGRVFEGKKLGVNPRKIGKTECWAHEIRGGGRGFEITANARAYAHACWSFEKNVAVFPFRSKFKYNEYPAVLETLEVRIKGGETLRLEKGVGNMENSWGFLI